MGQKVNPIGFRLGVNRDWRTRWYASPQEMPEFLHSDIQIRDYVKKKLQFAADSKVVIEQARKFRAPNGIAKVRYRCIPCAPGSITDFRKPTPFTARSE